MYVVVRIYINVLLCAYVYQCSSVCVSLSRAPFCVIIFNVVVRIYIYVVRVYMEWLRSVGSIKL